MKVTYILAPALIAAMLSGCSALPFGHKDKLASTAANDTQQTIDPGLKIAVDVVMARLRAAEPKDQQAIKQAAPEIFQLAAALMPTSGTQAALGESHQGRRIDSPRTLGELQRMGARTKLAKAGVSMNGARVMNASYGTNGAKTPPQIAKGRSLLHAVHLGSYRSEARAFAGFTELKAKIPTELASLTARIERVDLGPKGIFERLKAGPFTSREAAQTACVKIRAAGLYCALADFTGHKPG